MGFERIAERKIRDAMQQGEFDNLPNAGTPVDLDEYFKWPADLRLAYSVLKSADCVPEEVALLNDIAALERAVAAAGSDQQRATLRRTLASRQTQLGITLERARRR